MYQDGNVQLTTADHSEGEEGRKPQKRLIFHRNSKVWAPYIQAVMLQELSPE